MSEELKGRELAPHQLASLPAAPEPSSGVVHLAPREKNRRVELDAARGFALLGIVLVNVDLFSLPMGLLEAPGPYEAGVLPTLAAVFVEVFCAGKFYPLFALLFGIGVALQRANVVSRGFDYLPLGLRRMGLLFLFGAAHVLLLWYGDILMYYATAGAGLVLLSGLSAASKMRLGVALVVLATVVMAVIGWLVPGQPVDILELRDEARLVEIGAQPFTEMSRWIDPMNFNLADPQYVAAETKAYVDGGFLQALGFRMVSFTAIVAAGVVGLWWSVLGLFLLGAGLLEWGLFKKTNERFLLRFLMLAMMVGLPASAIFTLLSRKSDLPAVLGTLALAGPMIIGPVMALAYLSAITLMVRHRILTGTMTALAGAGRMALTNYLGQSLVLCYVFYHWGLGLYGQMPGHHRVLLAVGLFLAQVVVSRWWLQRFRFGPLEWLWRTATYGRRPLFRRAVK